ncbi:MAG: hypothetical protein AWU57_584, partial [Marinobacter sp. T13-3]
MAITVLKNLALIGCIFIVAFFDGPIIEGITEFIGYGQLAELVNMSLYVGAFLLCIHLLCRVFRYDLKSWIANLFDFDSASGLVLNVLCLLRFIYMYATFDDTVLNVPSWGIGRAIVATVSGLTVSVLVTLFLFRNSPFFGTDIDDIPEILLAMAVRNEAERKAQEAATNQERKAPHARDHANQPQPKTAQQVQGKTAPPQTSKLGWACKKLALMAVGLPCLLYALPTLSSTARAAYGVGDYTTMLTYGAGGAVVFMFSAWLLSVFLNPPSTHSENRVADSDHSHAARAVAQSVESVTG